MNQSLTLSFGLPGMNEIIRTAKKHPMAYATMKKKYTRMVEKEMLTQQCIPDKPYETIRIQCAWIESGRARDPDNVRAGIKFILDAMVNTGVIKDDSRKYVKFLGDTFPKGNKRMVEVSWLE
jgi:Holliday junction resolvase RusA-like endonuclease